MRPAAAHLPLALVSIAAFVSGMAAFTLATPDGSDTRRVRADQLGFGELRSARITQAVRVSAAHHHRAALETATAASATRAGVRWLRAVGGSAAPGAAALPREVTTRGGTPDQLRATSGFVRWADGIPASAWSIVARPAQLDPGDELGADDTAATGDVAARASTPRVATITATASVTLRRAEGRTGVQRLPLTLRLVAIDGTATRAPRRWRAASVAVGGGATGVRAYRDPVVVRRTRVDVVAEATRSALATRVADHAQRQLPRINASYPGIATDDAVAIWLLETPAVARRALGRAAPADVAGAEALGWADERGEVAFVAPRLAQEPPEARDAAVRHELAHVATRSLGATVPPVLLEGLATAHERGLGAQDVPAVELDAALTTRRTDLAQLLVADPAGPLTAATDPRRVRDAYLAGYATVAWIEARFGHDRLLALLRQLDTGPDAAAAYRTVLRRDPTRVAAQVRAWAHARAVAAAEPAPADPTPLVDEPVAGTTPADGRPTP